MSEKRFIMTQNFRSPYVAKDGGGVRPHAMAFRTFSKGQQFNGRIVNDAQGKPLFIMADNALTIPLSVVKEVVVRDTVISNAEGDTKDEPKIITAVKKDAVRFKYTDAGILGALLGFGIYKYAVKKTWILPENKHMAISIAVTAGLAMYGVHRFTSSKPKTNES